MSYFPDEARLIERMWGLICNSADLKSTGIKWKRDHWGRKNIPVSLGLSDSPDSIAWRETMASIREEYHNWLSFFIYTHPQDVPVTNPTVGELIDALKLACDCGQEGCNAVVVPREHADLIIERLKIYAIQERDSGTAG